MGEVVCPLGAHRNFDTFYGVKHQEAQLAIKDVEIQDVIKASARAKLVREVVCFEREHVASKTIIINVREVVSCALWIRDHHSARYQQLDLLVEGKCRLGVLHTLCTNK